jgi:hypothetical protein
MNRSMPAWNSTLCEMVLRGIAAPCVVFALPDAG